MHALISGGNGVIGKSLIPLLLKNGVKVTSLVRSQVQNKNQIDNISYIEGKIDINNSIDKKIFSKFNCFIDLAWEDVRDINSESHLNFNLKAHKDFISKIVGAGVKNIFVLGSCYEYGLQNGELSEASALMPVTNYGKAKTLLLEYLEDLSNKQKFNFIWGRLFYIYGDAQPKDTFFGQLREAISKRASSFDINSADKYLDYLKLNEAANIICKLIINFENYGVVNICSGKPISLFDLATKISDELNSKIEINVKNDTSRKHEPDKFWGDPTYLKSILKKNNE